MKAVQIHAYGGVDVIDINNNMPNPTAGEGQILVEVHAASINPFDVKLREGSAKEMIPLEFPATLGGDYAGKIVEVGPAEGSATDLRVGDEVYGTALRNGGSGGFAQVAAAKTATSAHKPRSINFIEAAALPLVGSSAVQAIEEHIKLQNGQKILIHGGAGGIGSIAVQLAKSIGAYVATTVSGNDKEFAKKLGADVAIDYKNEKFEEVVKDFDAVYDTVGGDTTNRSFKILKRGGIIVSMLRQPNEALALERGVTAIGQGTKTNTLHLSRVAALVDAGHIKVQVDKVFPLEAAREAFIYLEKESPRGKVVLQIK